VPGVSSLHAICDRVHANVNDEPARWDDECAGRLPSAGFGWGCPYLLGTGSRGCSVAP
jgi:hypothetical protein